MKSDVESVHSSQCSSGNGSHISNNSREKITTATTNSNRHHIMVKDSMKDSRGLLYADLQLPKTSNNGSMKVKRSQRSHQWRPSISFSDRISLDQTIDTLDTSLDRSHSKAEDV